MLICALTNRTGYSSVVRSQKEKKKLLWFILKIIKENVSIENKIKTFKKKGDRIKMTNK